MVRQESSVFNNSAEGGVQKKYLHVLINCMLTLYGFQYEPGARRYRPYTYTRMLPSMISWFGGVHTVHTYRTVQYNTLRYGTVQDVLATPMGNATPNSPGTPAVALRSLPHVEADETICQNRNPAYIAHRRLTAHSEILFRSQILPTLHCCSTRSPQQATATTSRLAGHASNCHCYLLERIYHEGRLKDTAVELNHFYFLTDVINGRIQYGNTNAWYAISPRRRLRRTA